MPWQEKHRSVGAEANLLLARSGLHIIPVCIWPLLIRPTMDAYHGHNEQDILDRGLQSSKKKKKKKKEKLLNQKF